MAGSFDRPPVKSSRVHRRFWRPVLLAAVAAALLCLPVSSLGDLHSDLTSRAGAASQLRAQIAAESKRIAATGAGVRQAEARLARLQAEANARQAQLASVQRSVVAARNKLTRLEEPSPPRVGRARGEPARRL